MEEKKNIKIEKILIIYLLFSNMLQIFMIDSKGSTYDTIWKITVFASLFFYSLYKSVANNHRISEKYILIWIIYTILIILSNFFNGTLFNISFNNLISCVYSPILIFIFVVMFSNVELNEEHIKKYFKYVVFFVLYCCIFSIIYDSKQIAGFLRISRGYEINIASFFDNRNTYGLYILYGIISNIFILDYFKEKKIFYKITMAIFCVSALLTLSRTTIFSIIFFVLFLIIKARKTYTIKRKILFIFTSLILLFIIMQSIEYISTNILRINSGLTHRDNIWQYGLNIYKNSNTIVGIGKNEGLLLLKEKYQVTSFHNTCITILVSGGILNIIANIIIYGFSIFNIKRIKKYNLKLYILFLDIFITYLIGSFFETHELFESSATSFILTTFITLLPLYLNNNYINKQK